MLWAILIVTWASVVYILSLFALSDGCLRYADFDVYLGSILMVLILRQRTI